MPRRRQGVTGNGNAMLHKAKEVARPGKCWHLGQWAFIEIADPWDAKHVMDGFLAQTSRAKKGSEKC